jgi:hypothetical protein
VPRSVRVRVKPDRRIRAQHGSKAGRRAWHEANSEFEASPKLARELIRAGHVEVVAAGA